MKPLLAWATGFKNNYTHRVFLTTWINIVVFHTFFVLIMAVVFYYTLDYAKETIFNTIATLLQSALSGIPPDPTTLDTTIARIDEVSMMVLIGMSIFSVLTAVAAAYITLKPTRKALAIQKRFVSSVAHELRTPLSVMRTNNEVALYDIDKDSPIRETIEDTIDETLHLTNILNNLLIFSRVDTTETMLFATVEVNEVVETVIRKLQDLATRKHVHLTSSLAPNITVYGNQAAIEQALFNLVKNGIAYSKPTDGVIHIQTTGYNDTATIDITDNGVGISSKDLPHIFSPFFRVSESRKSSDSMGMGLSLVYEVMKLHNGSISVKSELGEGTTFTLTFRRPAKSIKRKTASSSTSDTIAYDFGKQ